MLYVASINQNNDAIVFSENSSIFSEYSSIAIVVETLPEGVGSLKCNGTEIWYEPIPEPEPLEPTETEKLRADVDYIAMETGVMLDV